jgi:eukaryotic-like serine/threonine-protein kinase
VADEIGQLVQGRYELIELAGSGGMARVYRAVVRGAAGFQRSVALKRIREHLTGSTEFVRMFIEEARVCSELDHANIVQVHDFGMDSEGYFLIMEWVDGVHVGQYMDQLARSGDAMPWRQAAEICAQVLAGLASAHDRVDPDGLPSPVIHRDVTPQNILLSVIGVVKLTDFGLARAMDRAPMTGPDVVKGKLSYLAPELLFGQPATVTSDLYSLGIVLWEMLAGERLFWADSASERVRKVREAEIPPLATRRNTLPAAMLAIVDKALDKDPTQRFQSAQEMHDALVIAMGDQLVSARELGGVAIDTRLAQGLSARSHRPPRRPSAPPGSPVTTNRVVVVKAS